MAFIKLENVKLSIIRNWYTANSITANTQGINIISTITKKNIKNAVAIIAAIGDAISATMKLAISFNIVINIISDSGYSIIQIPNIFL